MIGWIRTSTRRGRAFVVALLLACLTLQPILVFACDVHDLAHAASASVDAGTGDTAAATPAPDRGEGGSLLHDVLHAAHCCVHAPALPSVALAAIAFARADLVLAHGPPSASEAHPSNLLRPPIAG